jgi:hypothetical protein
MPPYRCLPWGQGALSVCLFLGAVFYSAIVSGACGCYTCLSGRACALRTDVTGDAFTFADPVLTSEADESEVPYAEFRIQNRWTSTGSTPSVGGRGNPITVTWGIVADGTPISGNSREPSSLIAMLNSQYGAGPGGIDNAPWMRFFHSAFGRWSELSGVTYRYEPFDGGAAIDGTTAPSGRPGVYPDVRIGGHSIDGASGSNTLAYNYFPSHSDMVIDTDNFAFYGNRDFDSRRLRNVLMHEAGHGLGLNHLESNNSAQLMEPFISTAFDGPQIDDILAIHRNYGDVLEKNGGNDTFALATPIGAKRGGDAWAIGTNGGAQVVASNMTDFVSIDGSTDRDYYRFTVTERVSARVVMNQVGRTYNEGPQDGEQTSLVTSQLNPLNLSLYSSSATDGIALLAEAEVSTVTRKLIEEIVLEPDSDYLLFVRGTVDNVQLYRLDLLLTAAPVPEPLALATALTGLVVAAAPRRSAA